VLLVGVDGGIKELKNFSGRKGKEEMGGGQLETLCRTLALAPGRASLCCRLNEPLVVFYFVIIITTYLPSTYLRYYHLLWPTFYGGSHWL